MSTAEGGSGGKPPITSRSSPGGNHEEFEAFIHNIVHDLRSPLVTIESMVLLLRDSAEDRLRREEAGYLDHIENGARLMRDLLGDLSELTLIRRHIETPANVDTGAVLKQVLADLGGEISRLGARVELPDTLPEVKGDKEQVAQIFRQVVDNALKFRREGHSPSVAISVAPAGEFLEFAVKDNGIGIPIHFQERVFGIFTKLHPRSKFGGNGIGLAIAKRCVEAHGGTVTLESAEGQGTTVRFTLPA